MADQVYQIDKAGNLTRCGPGVVGKSSSVADDEAKVNRATDNNNLRPTKPAKLDASSDTASFVTDRTVYRIYFRAIGLRNMLVFVLFGLAFAFCIKFPGEYHTG